MAGIEKNDKGHSSVSRSRAAPHRVALKHVHGSNDIAMLVASHRVAIIVGQVFFTGFIPESFECGAECAHRVGISACNGNFVGRPLFHFIRQRGGYSTGPAHRVLLVFIVWCIAKP